VVDRRGGVASSVPQALQVTPLDPPIPDNRSLPAEVAYAEFTATPLEILPGGSVTFTGAPSGEWNWTFTGTGEDGAWQRIRDRPDRVARWTWSFGDGDTLVRGDATGASAGHAFGDPGLYFVKLTVLHLNGSQASWGVTVRVA
jgi:PKD repeat protein